MANRQNAWIFDAMCLSRVIVRSGEINKYKNTYSEIAQARANPSAVDVPLPSSSMMTSEFSVADYNVISQGPEHSDGGQTLKMFAVSSISAMKVETPLI